MLSRMSHLGHTTLSCKIKTLCSNGTLEHMPLANRLWRTEFLYNKLCFLPHLFEGKALPSETTPPTYWASSQGGYVWIWNCKYFKLLIISGLIIHDKGQL